MDFKRVSDVMMGSEPKRARIEAGPSKVLYFRNLSPTTTENDILSFCGAFGRVSNVLRLKEKNQAFVEMENIESATTMMNFFALGSQPVIQNQVVAISFSARQEVTTAPARPPKTVDALAQDAAVGPILHVSISNMTHDVPCDLLHQIFSQYGGNILKIVCFEKSGNRQALVEYSDTNAALVAKSVLNNHSIYQDGCVLKIVFSRLTQVNVRPGDVNSRDFTAPSPTAGNYNVPPYVQGINIPWPTPTMPSMKPPGMNFPGPMQGAQTAPNTPFTQWAHSKVLLVNNLNKEKITCNALFKLFGTCGDVMRIKILFHKRDMAFIQFRDEAHAYRALTHLKDSILLDQKVNIQVSKMQEVPLPPPQSGESYDGLTQDYSTSRMHRFAKPTSKNLTHITAPNAGLHLSNIPEGVEEFQLRQLFTMFGVVESFKFFATSQKMAILRMDSAASAINALIGLHGESLEPYNLPAGDGRGLVISFAKGPGTAQA